LNNITVPKGKNDEPERLPRCRGEARVAVQWNHKGFRFVVRSSGAGTDKLLLSGDGRFDLDEGGDIEGGGSFDQFTLTPPAPFPVVARGSWKARKFVSFALATVHPASNPEGTHGVYQAGVLKFTADFRPMKDATVKDVSMEVVCNLGSAGASTPGLDEGVYVTFPDGTAYVPEGIGVTIFNINHEPGE
jgi:hypothetical protein